MLNDKIEFYGKMLSMRAIALRIGVSRDTLQKHFDRLNDIYEAEKICRKIIEDKGESLVKYNGESLAIQTIAKKEGIKDAKTLKKNYEQTGDIDKAIKRCKANKYEYNGEMLTINAIAQREGIRGGTLKKYYEQTGDIYEAINQYYQKKEEYESGRIEYKGELKFLRTIAKDEGVEETTLDRYYKKYGNIDKAVFMAKIQRSRSQKVTIKNTELSLSDLSIILGIK